MERHELDPLALIFGLVGLIAGVVALLHQSDVISLGPGPVLALSVLVIGIAGIAYGAVELKRR